MLDKALQLLVEIVLGLGDLPLHWLLVFLQGCVVFVILFLPCFVFALIDYVFNKKRLTIFDTWGFRIMVFFQILWLISAVKYIWSVGLGVEVV